MRIRDHLANVRTFLAWLRTGLTLFVLGYAVAKFQLVENVSNQSLGIAAAMAGWLVIVIAGVSFIGQQRAIDMAGFRPSIFWNVALSALAASVAASVLIHLILS